MKKRYFVLLLVCFCSLVFWHINTSAETIVRDEVTVHFYDTDCIGKYTGEINEQGYPNGFGIFEAVNDSGNQYRLVGEWVDGHLTGNAWCLFDNGDFNIGEFDDGHFVVGTYARNVNVEEYDERPKNPDENNLLSKDDLITYEQLLRYEELFDPNMEVLASGRVPVKIEVIISGVEETQYGYDVHMWIKGEKGYCYKCNYIDPDEYPFLPEYGQKIIYEITPYSDGSFSGNQIKSYQIVDDNVDFRELKPAELKTYTELQSVPNNEIVVVDWVVGEEDELGNQEIWVINTEEEYEMIKFDSSSIKPEYGQRLFVVAEAFNGSVEYDFEILHYVVVENNIDVSAIEEKYYTTDEVMKHLFEAFDRSVFISIPYKRIMRDLEGNTGCAILLEGKYQQILNELHGLFSDNDGNYYHLLLRKAELDFKLLEKDKIRVYGFIMAEPYQYKSWTGDKTVPSILVKHIDLLEED